MTHRKFRIWNGHKMEYNVMVGFLGVFYVEGLDKKDSACMSSFNTKYPDDTTEMEFTGLHDKNGKEVFDGDILANSDRDDDDNIYVCEYDNSQASFVFTSPFDGESLEQNDFVSDLVIIGNRYENEELLK